MEYNLPSELVKNLHFGDEAKSKVITGVNKLAQAVKSTLGASGKCVVYEDGRGRPVITKDGVTVAESVVLYDSVENMGATLIKEAARNTVRDAGDGTTTATVLAEALIKQIDTATAEGLTIREIKDGVNKTLDNAKLRELLNILDEIQGKVIIWSSFRYSIELIAREIAKKYKNENIVATLYGDTKNRADVVDNFNSSRGARFLVSNPSVGGYGLTLNASSYQIFFNNSYNLEERLQAEARNHRSGQTADKVTYIDLVAIS